MTQHIDYIASTPSQIASDISSRHPLAIDDLHSIIHHPRSLARPTAAWRPPVKNLPAHRGGPLLVAAITRRRVGPRARARIQGWGEPHVPAYLIEVRFTDTSGAIVDPHLTEAWIRSLVTEDYADAVHEIASPKAVTYVWLVDTHFTPVSSPPSMFDGMTAA
ncbi:hypothetical protein M3B02_03485 [Corynebacterium sanguinis]|uniref:hypothetical protein n=1 Tax=Corynebacterium sanguinis TaxID=2594913 RepID=UPI00223B2CD5|nr:hypothetical protein [Corynebacterium sanguinis]MCT1613419.1 hypothetical protein [Corynebacterium sanguinis]